MTHIDQLHARTVFVNSDGTLTNFAFRFLIQTWERLGGPDDVIEDTQNGELYESGITDSKLIQLMKQVEELELLVEQNSDSKIRALEKRIEELEVQLETLQIPSLTNIESRLNELEIDTEMNYGA